MYSEPQIERLLKHCVTNSWLTVEQAQSLRLYFHSLIEVEQLTTYHIEGIFDVEYQICDLEYALNIMESV